MDSLSTAGDRRATVTVRTAAAAQHEIGRRWPSCSERPRRRRRRGHRRGRRRGRAAWFAELPSTRCGYVASQSTSVLTLPIRRHRWTGWDVELPAAFGRVYPVPPSTVMDPLPNFDFPTATFSQITGLEPGRTSVHCRDPWVVELHPETASVLVVGIIDVMGAMDGINEAALTVVLLADNETPDPEPTGQPCVGLSEQQVVRYLLDTCATVAEAKKALLAAKHYYFFTPCHFVVADRSGEAFVWEHSPRRNREWIVQSNVRGDQRLVCTNHLLHQWPDPILLPADDGTIGTAAFTYRRWRTLTDVMADGCVVDNDDIREHFRAVSFVAPIAEARTFWHALYDVDDASAELTFHVRDVDGVTTYSDPIQFGLGQ